MKTIIAATSFAERSLYVADYAADMALDIQAALLLLHVVQIPTSFDTTLAGYEYGNLLKSAEEDMADLKRILLLRTKNGIVITTKVVAGTLREDIEEVCSVHKPFMVIAGTERNSFADRLLFGSHVFSIVKSLHYPMLLVPPGAVFKRIKKIILASDGKDIKDAAAGIIIQMAGLFSASVDIVHVVRNLEKNHKNTTLPAKHFPGVNLQTNFITGDDTGEAIHNYAIKNEDGLVVVIAREHGFLTSLVRKSQSGNIALHPPVPVLALAE